MNKQSRTKSSNPTEMLAWFRGCPPLRAVNSCRGIPLVSVIYILTSMFWHDENLLFTENESKRARCQLAMLVMCSIPGLWINLTAAQQPPHNANSLFLRLKHDSVTSGHMTGTIRACLVSTASICKPVYSVSFAPYLVTILQLQSTSWIGSFSWSKVHSTYISSSSTVLIKIHITISSKSDRHKNALHYVNTNAILWDHKDRVHYLRPKES